MKGIILQLSKYLTSLVKNWLSERDLCCRTDEGPRYWRAWTLEQSITVGFADDLTAKHADDLAAENMKV